MFCFSDLLTASHCGISQGDHAVVGYLTHGKRSSDMRKLIVGHKKFENKGLDYAVYQISHINPETSTGNRRKLKYCVTSFRVKRAI